MSLNNQLLENPITLKKQGGAPATPASGNQAFFIDTNGLAQMKKDDGSVVGIGGLTLTDATHATTTLAAGKHYLYDMSGASADVTATMPAGSIGANIRVFVKSSATYDLKIEGNGAEQIFYNGTQYDDIQITAGLETWVEFAWDDVAGYWVAEDSTVPVNGTWSGDMAITGALSFPVTSLSNAQSTSMGLKQYLSGTSYNGGNSPTISGANHSNTELGIFIPYQMQDGSWRLRFNIEETTTNVQNPVLTINGVVFKSGYYQGVSLLHGAASGWAQAQAMSNSGNINIYSSAATTVFRLSGDVALESKPTWAY